MGESSFTLRLPILSLKSRCRRSGKHLPGFGNVGLAVAGNEASTPAVSSWMRRRKLRYGSAEPALAVPQSRFHGRAGSMIAHRARHQPEAAAMRSASLSKQHRRNVAVDGGS